MDGAIRVELFGTKVPTGKTITMGKEDSDTMVTTVQITSVALGEKAGDGRTVVYCGNGSSEWVMGSLIPGRCEQFQVDYMGRQPITLRHTGKGDVYVSGFKTLTLLEDEDEDEETPVFEDTDEDEDEDDEDEEDVGVKGAHQQLQLGNGRAGGQAARPAADDEDDEDDEDDSDELEGRDFSDLDSDGDEDDDEEDDEDDEDDEEEDESEDEEDLPPQTTTKGNKRATVSTPQTASKKSKVEGGEDDAAYERALKQFLKKEGASSLSTLGSKVQGKPANIKMKKFIEDRPAVFKIDAEGKVHCK